MKGAQFVMMTLPGVTVACLLGCVLVLAQESTPPAGGNDLSALAKQSHNPVANLNTLLFLCNFGLGGGLGTQSMMILNVMPALP